MSVITGISAAEPGITRIGRAAAVAVVASAPAPLSFQRPGRAEPAPRVVPADVVPDARFAGEMRGANAHVVRQVVQQITATLAYGARVSVVSTGTTIHATIDVSG
jgi:hypothetical protein